MCCGAELIDTRLSGANLTDANLVGADLSGALNLTQGQLDLACGMPKALPPGLIVKPCSPDWFERSIRSRYHRAVLTKPR